MPKIAFLLPRARRRACAMMARDMAAEWAIAQQRLGDEDRDMLAGHALNPHDIRLLIGTARIRLFARGRFRARSGRRHRICLARPDRSVQSRKPGSQSAGSMLPLRRAGRPGCVAPASSGAMGAEDRRSRMARLY